MTPATITAHLEANGWTVELANDHAIRAVIQDADISEWSRDVALSRIGQTWWLYCAFRCRSGKHERPITEKPLTLRSEEDLDMALAMCGPKSHAHRIGEPTPT